MSEPKKRLTELQANLRITLMLHAKVDSLAFLVLNELSEGDPERLTSLKTKLNEAFTKLSSSSDDFLDRKITEEELSESVTAISPFRIL